MKLLPLIGALLLSTAPVHASQTPEELTKPCEASEEATKACFARAMMAASYRHYRAKCTLWKAGVVIPPEVWGDDNIPAFGEFLFEKDEDKAMWNIGIKMALEDYPNCPIKPIP